MARPGPRLEKILVEAAAGQTVAVSIWITLLPVGFVGLIVVLDVLVVRRGSVEDGELWVVQRG